MGKLTLVVRAYRILRSPQGKRVGASAVDLVARAATRVAGPRYATRIEKVRSAALRGLQRL